MIENGVVKYEVVKKDPLDSEVNENEIPDELTIESPSEIEEMEEKNISSEQISVEQVEVSQQNSEITDDDVTEVYENNSSPAENSAKIEINELKISVTVNSDDLPNISLLFYRNGIRRNDPFSKEERINRCYYWFYLLAFFIEHDSLLTSNLTKTSQIQQ